MVKAWWAKMPGTPNFGDLITEYIFNKRGIQLQHAQPEEAELVGCGSILDPVPDNYRGYILGAGMMFDRNDKNFSQAKVITLRGKLTAKNVGCANVRVGDLGLLLGKDVKPVPKVFRLGIIPHYVDKQNQQVFEWSKVPGVKIIDVFSPIDQIIAEVNMCSGICSSSLHGLILADALKVPSRWVELSDKVNGKGFKFRDYYSCYDLNIQPSRYIGFVDELFNRPNIDQIIQHLDNEVNNLIKQWTI